RRALGAALIDGNFVLPQQGMRPMLGLYGFRGCKGLQPSKSRRTIGALIKTWRAPVPRRRAGRWNLRFAATRQASNVGPLWVPRLQRTAALQVKEDHWSLD